MAGSWEILQQQQVLVVILTREIVTTAWAGGFRNLIIPGSYTFLSGAPYDMARNTGCQKLLEIGWSHLMFIDDDTILPPDGVLRLLNHKLPIVSGLYYRRNLPLFPVMLRENEQGRNWITEYTDNSLMEVDYVGSGCMMIHRDVLTTVPQPWFEWKVDRMDLAPDQRMSEDFSFCQKARQHGYKIIVDTSIKCKHLGLCQVEAPGTIKPAELM